MKALQPKKESIAETRLEVTVEAYFANNKHDIGGAATNLGLAVAYALQSPLVIPNPTASMESALNLIVKSFKAGLQKGFVR